MDKSGKREEWIDVVRGILVVLMVVGHCIQGGSGADYYSEEAYFDNWVFRIIYSFHMPCFMMIAGFFFKHRLRKPGFWKNRVDTILVPLVAWSLPAVAIGFARAAMMGQLSIMTYKNAVRILLSYSWFLWAILFCSCVVWIVFRFLADLGFIHLLIGVLFMLTSDQIIPALWKFMYPFFVAGYYWKGNRWIKENKTATTIALATLFLILIPFFQNSSFIYTTGITVRNVNQLWIDLYRYVIGFVGSALLIWVVYLVYPIWRVRENHSVEVCSYLGKISLSIYCMSGYINQYLLYRLTRNVNPNFNTTIIETALVLGTCVCLNLLIQKIPLARKVLLGGR